MRLRPFRPKLHSKSPPARQLAQVLRMALPTQSRVGKCACGQVTNFETSSERQFCHIANYGKSMILCVRVHPSVRVVRLHLHARGAPPKAFLWSLAGWTISIVVSLLSKEAPPRTARWKSAGLRALSQQAHPSLTTSMRRQGGGREKDGCGHTAVGKMPMGQPPRRGSTCETQITNGDGENQEQRQQGDYTMHTLEHP